MPARWPSARGPTTLGQLEPAALAEHAPAIAATLEDSDKDVRTAAMATLSRLEPAVLTHHGSTIAAKLEIGTDGQKRALRPHARQQLVW